MSAPPRIFDRARRRRASERAHKLAPTGDFLRAEVASRLAERVADIRRPLATVLELGAVGPALSEGLAAVGRAPLLHLRSAIVPGRDGGAGVVADEEALPFRGGSFDAVLSVNTLHLVNDLPGTLLQIRDCLRPDGLLLAAFPGGDSLAELRWALTQAELELAGGAAGRVAPFVDVRDAGALLQRAGFALPMVDLDRITVAYREPLRLFADLRAMGETGVLAPQRSRPLTRAVVARAAMLYRERFADAEGRVPATFDILFVAGWRPDASQPRPAARGSGRVDLGGLLGRS